MANVHVYILCETMNVSNANRDTFFDAMRAILGQGNGSQPAFINHDRVRLDGNALIIEALFDENDISISQMKQYLGDVFSINPADIGNVNDNTNIYGLQSTLSYPNGVTDRINYIAFGYDGGWPSWSGSRAAVLQYLADNRLAWDGEA